MHSVKNRFLMRIKNADRRTVSPLLAAHDGLRDLVVMGGAVLADPLAGGLLAPGECLPRALRARRKIMRRRRIDDATLAGWFSFEPVSMPLGEPGEPPVAKRRCESASSLRQASHGHHVDRLTP